MARFRSRLTYANVMSSIAVFALLGGGAYAAVKLPKNSVTSKQVKNRSLLAKDFKRGQLPAGAAGQTGATGPKGAAGATGAPGEKGDQGEKGDTGPAGATGPAGPAGTNGTNGTNGSDATKGLSAYAYIYNVGAQVVAVEADVTFDTNGVLTGITHTAGAAAITVTTTGTYKVSFSVSGVEPNQMAIFLNGVLVPGTTYGSGAGTQQNAGQALVAASAGDVLTIRNHTSAAAVTLSTLIGGTAAATNASVVIEKLS